MTAKNTSKRKRRKVHVVLGGGGIKGLSHLGFLRALDELNIEAETLTGVSIGSMVAAIASNGYPTDEVETIFWSELEKLNPSKLTRSMLVPQVIERLVFRSEPFSLRAFMEELVKRYQLKPNKRLRIMAFDVFSLKPYVFEGEDYDLAEALTASCALPYLFRPIMRDGHCFYDGGIYHPNPGNLGPGPYLIAKLGHAKNAPSQALSLGDALLHNTELVAKRIYAQKDPQGHMVLDISDPSIATMTFGLTEQNKKQLVDRAYEKTRDELSRAFADGSFQRLFGSAG